MNRNLRRALSQAKQAAKPAANPAAGAGEAPPPGTVVTIDQAMNIALGHHQAGRLEAAEAIYRQVLGHHPEHPGALHFLGMVESARGDKETALALVSRSLEVLPRQADALSNLGTILKGLGRYEEAIDAYRRALAINPDFVEAMCNLANALSAVSRIDESIATLKRVIEIKPDHYQAYLSLGILYRDEGFAAQAIEVFDRAFAMRPDDLVGRFDRALALLVAGDYARGWPEYELRWDQDHLKPHKKVFPQPLWQGEDLAGKTILVHGEQGFGDTLQFARYIPLLAERGAKVLLAVQPQLDRVMKTLDGVDYLHPSGQVVPPFHCHTPLISLPRLFGTRVDTVPRNVPFLSAEPELVESWAARMGPKKGLRVGLVWAGVPTFKADAKRSPRLDPLMPLFEVAGVEFFGLQMGHGRKDLEGRVMPANFTDLGTEITDFADTAAIMTNLDLCITSCTGPAHLAGALGRPIWIMLYHAADWRWLYEREDSPWYPSARLFRQQRHGIGGWQPVVERIREQLTVLAAGDPAPLTPKRG